MANTQNNTMDQQQQTEAFSHELGLLIQRFAREFDLPLPSCIGVLEIHKNTLLSTHGLQDVLPKPAYNVADVPRHIRPAFGGDTQTVLPTDWKLWACVQESGREYLSDWGPEAEMRKELQREAERNRDVWLIDPSGEKHLPT